MWLVRQLVLITTVVCIVLLFLLTHAYHRHVYVWSGLSVDLGGPQRQTYLPVDSEYLRQPRPVSDAFVNSSTVALVHHTRETLSRFSVGVSHRSLDYCNVVPPTPSDVVTDEGRLSEELRLVAVFIITRHGHRAPMYSLPGHTQPATFNCHLGSPDLQSSPIDITQAVDFVTAADAMLRHGDEVDPAWRRYGLYPASTSSCTGAKLTTTGALQMMRLGLLLRAGYSDLLTRGSGVVVRTSAYSRTVQSAAALLYGLAGQTTGLIASATVELTRNTYLCLDKSSSWNVTCGCRSALNAVSVHRRHSGTRDDDERRLRTEIAAILNVSSSHLPWTAAILERALLGGSCQQSAVHADWARQQHGQLAQDNAAQCSGEPYVLLSQFCVNTTLPCDTTTGGRCVSSSHLDRMWRVVDRHGRRGVTDPEMSYASLLLAYPLLVDIVGRLADVAAADNGELPPRRSLGSAASPVRLLVYSGHDKTLTALLSSLRLHDGRWPVLGARVVIELAATITRTGRAQPLYYFRLLCNGRDVTSSLEFCRVTFRGACPLDNFIYHVYYHATRQFGHASHAQACAVH